jgi:prevent-host-death family protein
MNQYSISEAKNRLPNIIRHVEKGPHVLLSRRGTPVAVIMSISEYTSLSPPKGNFWKNLQKLRRKMVKENIFISEQDMMGLRDLSPGRESDSWI